MMDDTPKTGLSCRFAGTAAALTLLALRLPLWMLPGPGRDEAAYHYWAHHAEPAYSLLLQWSVRLSEAGLGHSLWSLRLPALTLGFVVLLLNDWRLAAAGAPARLRLLAALALAFSPWQGFVSSILHPDVFLLAALLCLVLSVQKNHLWLAVASATAAVLAKPTGLLALPTLWFLSGRLDSLRKGELRTARLVLVALAMWQVRVMNTALVVALADFGRLPPSLPWLDHGLAAAGSLIYQGGPLLIGISWFGAMERIGILRQGGSQDVKREAWASLTIGGVLVAVFLAALVLRGQFKANWVLPAAVLLWPTRPPQWIEGRRGRGLVMAGVALACLGSLFQTAILTKPDLLATAERSLISRGMAPRWARYSTQAGVREGMVSSSATWGDHLREFAGISAFVDSIAAGWRGLPESTGPMAWIVASDYGLAFQIDWYLEDPAVRVAVLGDGIFHRTWSTFRVMAPEGPLLALSDGDVDRLAAAGWPHRRYLSPVSHPVTGRLMRPVALFRHEPFDKEFGDEKQP